MKQRFSALDVRATVSDLKIKIVGLRLQNVYDINPKTFLLKFAKPETKELVLIESGIRIHSTQFSREKNVIPSGFCMKLRKCCRTRRLKNVTQLGTDRIIDFEFAGGGEDGIGGYHIITEFYASGNVILTDHTYTILTLLRVVQPNEHVRMAVGEVYDTQSVAREFESITVERVLDVLNAAEPKDTLKKLLNAKLDYGPALTEHAIHLADMNPSLKIATQFDRSNGSLQLEALMQALKQADEIIKMSGSEVQKGYILLTEHARLENPISNEGEGQAEENSTVTTYEEFHPYLFRQMESKPYREFESFDQAVDEFFSKLESQKLELKSRAQEETAIKKLDAVRLENEARVEGLQSAQLTNTRKAELIEMNMTLVDQALLVVSNAVANSMDWKDLEDLVAEEQRKGNPIALVISGLKLETSQITLILSDPYVEDYLDSDDDEARPRPPETWKVDVDVHLSAYANARKYYDMKKQSAVKQDKTVAAAVKALKSAQRKIQKNLKETRVTATINKIRKPLWFEKFQWFISQDRYLIIAGRDAQQNELIVKRYLKKGDAYVHADLSGAASVVVKNLPEGGAIPPGVLAHAGIMSVCQSRAWDAKIVTSAWWVSAEQVSKTAPTGEYLTTGSFMIRGKKNFLPPTQLIYGFGILFKLDESSVARHVTMRREAEDEQKHTDTVLFADNDGLEFTEELDDDVILDDETKNKDVDIEAEGRAESPADDAKKEEDSDENSQDIDDENESDEKPGEKLDASADDSAVYDKYGLKYHGNVSEEEEDSQPGTTEIEKEGDNDVSRTKTQGRMSAKERRDAKKQIAGGSLVEGEGSVGVSAPSTVPQSAKRSGKTKKEATTTIDVPAPVRGKKAKIKKMKNKYGEQDEQERELRMELLGSAKGPQPKGKKAKREADKAAEAVLRREQRNKSSRSLTTKGDGNVDGETSNPINSTEERDLAADHIDELKTAASLDQETEEIRRLLQEENITVLDADEAENLSLLDSLTGSPLPDDVLLHAIPVCAPYAALQRFKYKVKLTPGTTKKGKAVKASVNFFVSATDASVREKELIKSIPDSEMITQMIGKVKVSAPNMEATKKKSKQKKKR